MSAFTFIVDITVILVVTTAIWYVVLAAKDYSKVHAGSTLAEMLSDFFFTYFLTLAATLMLCFIVPYTFAYKLVPPFVSQWLVTTFRVGTVAGNHEYLSILAAIVLFPVSAALISLALLAIKKLRWSLRALRKNIADGLKRTFK